MVTSIVVGVDGSWPAEAAARVAVELAAHQQARVHLVAVIEERPRYISAQEEIDREASAAEHYFQQTLDGLLDYAKRRGVLATPVMLTGHEVQQLLRYTVTVGADLLVIGSAGHSAVWESALGSTAFQLVRRAPCSVLVVRSPRGSAETPARLSRVGVALDGSPLGWEAFAEALFFAQGIQHPLHVLSVVDTLPVDTGTLSYGSGNQPGSTGESSAGEVWRTFLLHVQARAAAQAAAADVPLEVHMRAGPVSDALVASAKELGVDVLILGATGHERPWARVTGGTAMKVVEEAPCTVLVTRPAVTGVLAGDAMTPVSAYVGPRTPVSGALALLLNEAVRLLPVTSPDGILVGIVTLGMVLRRVNTRLVAALSRSALVQDVRDYGSYIQQAVVGQTVGAIMNAHPFTVRQDTPLDMAARYLTTHHITRAPVVDETDHLVGMVGEREAILGLLGQTSQRTGEPTANDDSSDGAVRGTEKTEKFVPVVTGTPLGATVLPSCGDLADRHIPVVEDSALMDEVLAAVGATPAGLVLVVQRDGRLRGVIETQFLLQELARTTENAAGGRLWQALLQSSGQVFRVLQGLSSTGPLVALRLARPAGCILPRDMPVGEALAHLISAEASGHTGVVVASDGHPIGVLRRSHALRVFVHG